MGLNPEDYLPLSQENEKRFQEDKEAIDKFIYLFGIGNNQVRGPKNLSKDNYRKHCLLSWRYWSREIYHWR